MNYSVIIPVFDGEKTLQDLTEALIREMKGTGSYEIIYLFDHGKETSWEILKQLHAIQPDIIKIFRLAKNYGQHSAVLFGISKAKGDYIISMDEDLQHDPRYINELISKQKELNAEVVYARFKDPKHSLIRKMASAILRTTLKYLIPGMGYYSSYRLIKRETALKLLNEEFSYTFIDAGLFRLNATRGYIDVEHRENSSRKSTYNLLKLVSHSVQILLAYTGVLRWMLFFSVLITSSAFLNMRHNHGSLAVKWLLFSGCAIFVLAVTGFFYKKSRIGFNSVPHCIHETN